MKSKVREYFFMNKLDTWDYNTALAKGQTQFKILSINAITISVETC